ncbi:UDP-glycosyltransferase UGT5-like [Teleopsis dalmanni]|uniref:UDP-glycosyltransferase UGT5-like n=1 Tax=Teleopsis dalmanni TaxID=139649 RepID=UPI0018CE132C|nr:UDP-glycosyltransferase UGT5-like [Teleopsis dalmanni]
MYFQTIHTLFIVILLLPNIRTANILGFFPAPIKSHLLIHCAIAETLAERGHNVTVVATLPNVNKTSKINYIHIDISVNEAVLSDLINQSKSNLHKMTSWMDENMQQCESLITHDKLQQFLNNHNSTFFDLVIFGYRLNDVLLGVAAHFKCPIIISTVVQPIFPLQSMIGNPHEISYVPSFFTGLSQPMSFKARLRNFYASTFGHTLMNYALETRFEKFYRLHFPAHQHPSLNGIRKNISLLFTNHHFSQGPIRPNVPAVIEIGGIQIKEKPNPLPVDIKGILDNSENGVIYFCLGSNVKPSHVTENTAKIMFEVLSHLHYDVLWKWENAKVPGIAKNIYFSSWLPQDDILAHPNVKLFITHAGQGSIAESLYHGVPMICIPFFGDQLQNARYVERSGYGLYMDHTNITSNDFKNTITEVVLNSKYIEAVKRFSVLYRDRPMTPRQTAVYWVEYVLRHKGARHLQSPAVHLNVFQLVSLDVILFLLLILILISIVIVKLVKLVINKLKKKKLKLD